MVILRTISEIVKGRGTGSRERERERRQQPVPNQSDSATATVNRRSFTTPGEKRIPVRSSQSYHRSPESTSRNKLSKERPVEMTTKNIKCFNCHEKDHMANSCPKGQIAKNARVVTNQQEKETAKDTSLWTRVLTMKDTKTVLDSSHDAKVVGPTYKINVTVEGIPTRAFLDHGLQVTIVRRQLLPLI